MRVSFLSGDVHCAGYGMFCSRDRRRSIDATETIPTNDELVRDPYFLPQIISSAIGNVPPPNAVLRALEMAATTVEYVKLSLAGSVGPQTVEQRMVPIFGPPDLSTSMLHGRRNWCDVTTARDGSEVTYTLRCEKELGSSEVDLFPITIPHLTSH